MTSYYSSLSSTAGLAQADGSVANAQMSRINVIVNLTANPGKCGSPGTKGSRTALLVQRTHLCVISPSQGQLPVMITHAVAWRASCRT